MSCARKNIARVFFSVQSLFKEIKLLIGKDKGNYNRESKQLKGFSVGLRGSLAFRKASKKVKKSRIDSIYKIDL